MAKIRVDLDHPIQNGETITFQAPCDCTSASDGLIVYYPQEDGTGTQSMTFTLKDSHNNTLHGLGNLFSVGALVAVIVNTTTKTAHILNADTNGYLESVFGGIPESVTISAGGSGGFSNAHGYFCRVGRLTHVELSFVADDTTTLYMMTLGGLPKGVSNITPVTAMHMGTTVERGLVEGLTGSPVILTLSMTSAIKNTVLVMFEYIAAD